MSISPEEVELAAGFVERNLPILIDYGKHFLKGANSQIRRRLPNTYQKYLATAAARYGRTKSFFIRDEPSSIYDFYVPLSASIGERKIKKADISKLQDISSLCVITGSAGSGKSVFMRHLFLSAINEGGKVPVFVELRDLNEDEFTVFDLILQSLKRNEFDLGSEYIRSALNDGHFLLLLDGYDEIDLLHRKKASKEILNISKMGKNISVFVSSRPDDVFSGWDNFSIAQLSPLTLEEASDLVEKLPYDDDIKKKFSIDLNKTLYVRHRSFLSNPLLLSIMLLTYGTSADIPNKLSIFYNLAYEALFQRHDALKGGYKREIRCHLDIQDFGRVFSAFSVSTYNKRQFRFSRMDALSAINKAITVTGIKVDSEKFLDDALQSVCLLIEDGLFIVFAHRSFQEYFVSKYISEQNEENQEMLIEKFWRNIEVD
ncbi:MAG: NACHT domain-containing protein, partial [Cyclobacteriaceae bacterium]